MNKIIRTVTFTLIVFCFVFLLLWLITYYLAMVMEAKINKKAITEGEKTMEVKAPMFDNGKRVIKIDFKVIGQGTKMYTFEMPYDDALDEEGNVKLATQNISRFIDEGKTIPIISENKFGLLSTRNIIGITFINMCVGQYTVDAGK